MNEIKTYLNIKDVDNEENKNDGEKVAYEIIRFEEAEIKNSRKRYKVIMQNETIKKVLGDKKIPKSLIKKADPTILLMLCKYCENFENSDSVDNYLASLKNGEKGITVSSVPLSLEYDVDINDPKLSYMAKIANNHKAIAEVKVPTFFERVKNSFSKMKQKLFPAQEEVKMIDSNDELTEDQKERIAKNFDEIKAQKDAAKKEKEEKAAEEQPKEEVKEEKAAEEQPKEEVKEEKAEESNNEKAVKTKRVPYNVLMRMSGEEFKAKCLTKEEQDEYDKLSDSEKIDYKKAFYDKMTQGETKANPDRNADTYTRKETADLDRRKRMSSEEFKRTLTEEQAKYYDTLSDADKIKYRELKPSERPVIESENVKATDEPAKQEEIEVQDKKPTVVDKVKQRAADRKAKKAEEKAKKEERAAKAEKARRLKMNSEEFKEELSEDERLAFDQMSVQQKIGFQECDPDKRQEFIDNMDKTVKNPESNVSGKLTPEQKAAAQRQQSKIAADRRKSYKSDEEIKKEYDAFKENLTPDQRKAFNKMNIFQKAEFFECPEDKREEYIANFYKEQEQGPSKE